MNQRYLVHTIDYGDRHNLIAVIHDRTEIEDSFLLDIKYSKPYGEIHGYMNWYNFESLKQIL
jgi:hypothetical protein